MDRVTDVVNIATIPASLAAGAYTFYAKTGEALYNSLQDMKLLDKFNEFNEERLLLYRTSILELGAEAPAVLKEYQKNWSRLYQEELKGKKFTNIFKRFDGVPRTQQLAIVVESVAVVGLVIGFGALLNQLNSTKKTQPDKSISG